MKLNQLAASLLFAGTLLFTGCGSDDATSSTSTPPANSAAVTHQTSVTTTTGERIAVNVTSEGFVFGGYEGKPVVLEFYGDTCPHCVESIPAYNNLQSKYGNDILLLTIDAPGQYATLNNAGLQGFVATHGITYRTVSQENQGNMKAYTEELIGPMNAVPYVLVMNKNGAIASRMIGPNAAQLEAAIKDVL